MEPQIADIVVAPKNTGFTITPPGPPDIVFSFGNGEVMRITQHGVSVAPNVSADVAAQVVIASLDKFIRGLVADKDAEIARLRAELAKKETH